MVTKLQQENEQRGEIRYGLSGLVPARLLDVEGRDLEVVYIDVSRRGLGVLVQDPAVRVGDKLSLVLDDCAPLVLTIRWSKPEKTMDVAALGNFARMGLVCDDRSIDLYELLQTFGCVDT